jgi:hypothetical protein
LEPQFAYEVAFSFCSRDEGLALSLDDRLKERFNTFFYPRKQEIIAGTDGEKTLNKVFSEQTRIAVVLYRSEWGKTPFTRIEETAIRNRAFNEGYGFTLWIAAEESVTLPPYVEKARIYYGLSRYGLDGAVAVIETAIQQKGGDTRPETLEDKAARLNRQAIAQSERLAFLETPQAVIEAAATARKLFENVRTRAEKLAEWRLTVETFLGRGKKDIWADVYGQSCVLAVTWHQPYFGTFKEAALRVELWEGAPPRPGRSYIGGEAPPRRFREEYEFDRILDGTYVWRHHSSREPLTNDQMADHALGLLIEALHKGVMEERPRLL